MKKQSWHVITVEVPREKADLASLFLFEQGASGIVEHEHNHQFFFTAYFQADRTSLQELQSACAKQMQITSCVTENIDPHNEDWKQYFSPHEIVPNLFILPSWEKESVIPHHKKIIHLDPGMAFGTGLHETTKLCAEALDAIPKTRATLLDVGCGSGILTLAAHHLGYGPLAAIEIDPVALEIAQKNIQRNDVKNVRFFSDLGSVEGTFSVIVANILLLTLLLMKEQLINLLAPHGYLILSGITRDQINELKEGFSSLIVVKETFKGEWGALILKTISKEMR